MATKDFRASQVRTNQMIASGSQAGKPSMLVVSASDSSGFNGEALNNVRLLADVGSDVFMFVTGSKNTRTDVTLFGGDVVISGTMYAERQVVEVDLSSTSSLSVSGSLIVSQSATISEGLVVNESGGSGTENDFRVESGNKTHALFVDASKDQFLVLSGGAATSANEGAGNDVNFYVSGAIGSQGTAVRGTSLFGGDVYISGSLGVSDINAPTGGTLDIDASTLDIDATRVMIDTTSFFSIDGAGTSNVTANGALTVSGSTALSLKSDGGAVNIESRLSRVTMAAGAQVSIDAGAQVSIDTTDTSDGVEIGTRYSGVPVVIGHTTSETTIQDNVTVKGNLGVNGVVTGSLGISGSLTRLVDGRSYLAAGANVTITSESNGQVTIASTGGSGSPGGTDTQVQFNDGGSFGGDSAFVFNKTSNTLTSTNLSGSLTRLADGTSYLVAGDNVTITSATNGQVTIASTGGGGGASYFDSSTDGSIFTTGSVLFAGSGGNDSPTDYGTDNVFYVSGAIDGKKTSEQKAIVFNGDTVVSGTIYGGVYPLIGESALLMRGNKIGFSSEADEAGFLPLIPSDVSFFVSGAINGLQSGNGVTAFGGDTFTSGSMYIDEGRYLFTDGIKHINSDHTQVIFTQNIVTLNSHGPNIQIDGATNEVVKFRDGGAGSFKESIFSHARVNQEFILFMSGGAGGSFDESRASDVSFYVSGSRGLRGTGIKGTAVFGGDTVFSGTIFNPGMQADTGGSAVKIGTTSQELFYETSDVRIKTDISTIDAGLSKVQNLRGVTFRNSQRKDSETEIGLIAQEVQTVVPEIVTTTPSGYLQVDYAKMVAVLIEAVKEQQTVIEDLKTRVEQLEN